MADASIDPMHGGVNHEWQAEMSEYTPSNSSPIDAATELTPLLRHNEVSRSDRQLAAMC